MALEHLIKINLQKIGLFQLSCLLSELRHLNLWNVVKTLVILIHHLLHHQWRRLGCLVRKRRKGNVLNLIVNRWMSHHKEANLKWRRFRFPNFWSKIVKKFINQLDNKMQIVISKYSRILQNIIKMEKELNKIKI